MVKLTYYKEEFMNRRKNKAVLMFAFILFFAAVLLSQPASPTRGFDFVVIVDQSGSMSGIRGPASDKLGVRNDMVKRTFDILAKDGVLNKVTHRLGVVSFGDDIRIDLALTPITPASVERLRRRLDRNLTDQSLGYTHFLAAFQAVKKMFATGLLAEPGKRIIILITDGAPYIDGINITSYRKELKQLVTSTFPHPDYQVHVIALNDPTSNYWKNYGDFWRNLSHNNACKLENDREEIFRTLHKVINDIVGTPAEHIPVDMYDNVIVPPYLDSVVFNIFRVNPDAVVTIFPADNRERPISNSDANVTVVNVGRTIQAVAVKNPKPGIWQIRKANENDRVDVYTQRFFPRGKLLDPNPDEPVRQFEKIFVKYRVEDGDHKPMKEDPAYPLTLELSLVKPDKSRVQMKMKRSPGPSEQSVFETTGEIVCDKKGTYKAEVVIATRDIENRQVTLFRDQWSRFQVNAANLIEGKLVSPEPLENIPLFRELIFVSNPLTFTFKFVHQNGNSLNLRAFFGDSHKDDILTAYAVTGNEEEAVPMTFTYKQDGELIGEPDGLTSPGKHHLKFRPNNSIVPSHYTLRMTPDHLYFTRNLSVLHWLQIIVLAAFILVLVSFLGYTFYINLRFPLKGILYIDRLGDRPLAEYPLNSRRHRVTLKAFPNETMIKKMTVKSARDKRGGVTVIKVVGNKKELFLEDRTLHDRGTATLKKVPYVLRYRLK